jgi:protein SCO1/2
MLRMFRFFILISVFLGVCAGLGIYALKSYRPVNGCNTRLRPDRISGIKYGCFKLHNTVGDIVNLADFKDQYLFFYFGYTHCPDYCPTALSIMAQFYNNLSQDYQKKIKMFFITVDPDRDTPQLLDDYVKMFHPGITPLTGTKEEINLVKEQYKVYANRVDLKSASDYVLDHSTYSYVIEPGGKTFWSLRHGFSASDLTQEFNKAVAWRYGANK